MVLGVVVHALHFGRRRRHRFPMRDNDLIRQLVGLVPSAPALIGGLGQTQVVQHRFETALRTQLTSMLHNVQELVFLGSRVAAIGRDYQRPFFRRRFSLESSAITSRRRSISAWS